MVESARSLVGVDPNGSEVEFYLLNADKIEPKVTVVQVSAKILLFANHLLIVLFTIQDF